MDPHFLKRGWPELDECVQYVKHIITPYLQKFDWEDAADDDEDKEYEYNQESDENEPPRILKYKRSNLTKFLHVVRTTRGYDIDEGLPVPLYMGCPFLMFRGYEDYVDHAVGLAIEYINYETGKSYKHVETLKVFDTRHGILHLTFTATAEFMKKKKMKKKNGKKKTKIYKVKRTHTFLAAVNAPGPDLDMFDLVECFRKPKGPAPWRYIERDTNKSDCLSF